MQWSACAPANIALIKYMGKTNPQLNTPANPSLSYTLNHLKTQVILRLIPGLKDSWAPLIHDELLPLPLSEAAIQRFLDHLQWIKTQLGFSGAFAVYSGNNFPHAAGLASSASSFAALTRAAVIACTELTNKPMPSMNEQIQWSQKGSGSSCRSFVEPWALWEGHSVKAIDLPYAKLLHQVIAIEVTEKKVSSSEAHRRVTSSPRFDSRPARATQNLETLLDALENQRWQQAYQVCWDEFHDMHALFHESDPAFSYFTSDTQSVLDALTLFWKQHGDGPLITMDAGPNIHLLYRPLQHDLKNLIHDQFKGQYHVL